MYQSDRPSQESAPDDGVVIGVAGDSQSTRCAVANLAGNVIGMATSGPGHYRRLGPEKAAASVLTAVTGALALAKSDFRSVRASCIGLAGLEGTDDKNLVARALEPLGGAPLRIVQHSRIALAGALDGSPGVLLMHSANAIAHGIGSDGVEARSVGWGWIIGGDGSVPDIGRNAVRAALTTHDARGQEASLRARICEHWKIERIDDALPRLEGSGPNLESDLAEVAQLVTELAAKGDSLSLTLLRDAGRALGTLTAGILSQLRFAEGSPLRVAVASDLLTTTRSIRSAVGSVIREAWPTLRVVEPRRSPLEGAVLLARTFVAAPDQLEGVMASGPIYSRIKRELLEAIRRGDTEVGSRLASERELCRRYGVSRMTVRQALLELESEGYLERVQGRGTFVRLPRLEQPLAALSSFTEDMTRLGLRPGAQVLFQDIVPADSTVSKALAIPGATPTLRLERVRFADDAPMAIEVSHLRADRVPGLADVDLANRSLYEVLKNRYGIRLTRASETLEAIQADIHHAEKLEVPIGSPLLSRERVSLDESGKPVEFARSIYRSDRFRFSVERVR